MDGKFRRVGAVGEVRMGVLTLEVVRNEITHRKALF
jgi:hypothetical protein